MSQGQPQRPQADQPSWQEGVEGPIKYGDVFNVTGELASKTITPQDAATMQDAENRVLGHTQKGGPAAVMQFAASVNERAGVVSHKDVTDIARNEGITISETKADGHRIISEAVLGQNVEPDVPMKVLSPGQMILGGGPLTIGEALEAAALSAGEKPVDQGEAAAISAAELRATGKNEVTPGGIGSLAQSAATRNTHVTRYEDMTKLSDVLKNATEKLPVDKPATNKVAEAVMHAEWEYPWRRNNDDTSTTTPPAGGVAASVAAAARLNEHKMK
ncbi:late embryogenesis abundant protein D-34 [Quillaja saponaria]|uniref:Late embryogenesis abundant protein D-34 n=1 Tax=Quillaja saponaria TaxID=32244 RepID=A0AAD7L0M7_QUISA|nr:late embryogenesis abundant protein D-34 [Quillaja saponaria]